MYNSPESPSPSQSFFPPGQKRRASKVSVSTTIKTADKCVGTGDLEYNPYDSKLRYTPTREQREKFLLMRSSVLIIRWRNKTRTRLATLMAKEGVQLQLSGGSRSSRKSNKSDGPIGAFTPGSRDNSPRKFSRSSEGSDQSGFSITSKDDQPFRLQFGEMVEEERESVDSESNVPQDVAREVLHVSVQDATQGITQDKIQDTVQGVERDAAPEQDEAQQTTQDSVKQDVSRDLLPDNTKQSSSQDTSQDGTREMSQNLTRDTSQNVMRDTSRNEMLQEAQAVNVEAIAQSLGRYSDENNRTEDDNGGQTTEDSDNH
ncbi:hypothetical protein ElyMa_006119500 [Elysia marginata]|uniref:Uncharacterized protein n=1 Tax=Elysia marginata TaxID=1093978 RepID=A0AAV4GV13_9GAST|nr:hypothetical protein ElyMa_006119500 [Elysia marginata]